MENIAIYARLSLYDGDDTVSNSINNQLDMLLNFIKASKEFSNYTVMQYFDDGFSGINLERPAVKEMLSQIRCRRVDTVIVKDFSRIGRNYLDVITLIDKIFPFMKVRFISVLDNYDSANNNDFALDMGVAFKSILNEFYIADISEKIKKAYTVKSKRGDFCGSKPSYGYKFESSNHNKFEIDNETAEVVKHIFKMRLNGDTAATICRVLNDENIPPPFEYSSRINFETRKPKLWKTSSIYMILKNPCYIGERISHQTSKDLKTKKIIQLPENEWVITKNANESIISIDDFEKVQKTFKKIYRKPTTHINNFSLKLYCDGCGYALEKSKNNHYRCRKKSETGTSRCFEGVVDKSEICSLILEKVKTIIGDYISTNVNNNCSSNDKFILDRKLKTLKIKKKEFYEKYIDKFISKDDYLSEKARTVNEIERLENLLNDLNNNLALRERFFSDSVLSRLKTLYNASELMKEHMCFVEKVVVYEVGKYEVILKNRDVMNIMNDDVSLYN